MVAFTATQIPGIAGRIYPPALAGSYYPNGIPIRLRGGELASIIGDHDVDEVVLAYSDLSHEDIMHKASAVLAAGANFRLLGPDATVFRSARPVVGWLRGTHRRRQEPDQPAGRPAPAGRRPAGGAGPPSDAVRRPGADVAQRFATLADIDASNPTIEEREEYEEPVRQGMVMYAGVDYRGSWTGPRTRR